jgi:Ser/Thr protein kinase RdoA (MazF antagonist)
MKARVPEPIKNKNNVYVDKLHNVYVTKYYLGKQYNGTHKEIMSVGSSLAILHKSLECNKIPYNYKARDSIYKILDEKELDKICKRILHKKCKTPFDIIVIKHQRELIKICNFLKTSIDVSNFSKQLIHYDLHPGNIIFSKKKVNSIIDFNTMRKDLVIYDIAYASFRLSLKSTKNIYLQPQLIKIFVKAYLKKNKIKKEYLVNFDYFLIKILYRYVSYLLRLGYFYENDKWSQDIEKFVQFLHIAYKMRKDISKIIKSINITLS